MVRLVVNTPLKRVLNKLPTGNTQWRSPKAQDVLTLVPGATRLRVVGSAKPQRMGYIRFRCVAVIPPVTVLSLRKTGSLYRVGQCD